MVFSNCQENRAVYNLRYTTEKIFFISHNDADRGTRSRIAHSVPRRGTHSHRNRRSRTDILKKHSSPKISRNATGPSAPRAETQKHYVLIVELRTRIVALQFPLWTRIGALQFPAQNEERPSAHSVPIFCRTSESACSAIRHVSSGPESCDTSREGSSCASTWEFLHGYYIA